MKQKKKKILQCKASTLLLELLLEVLYHCDARVIGIHLFELQQRSVNEICTFLLMRVHSDEVGEGFSRFGILNNGVRQADVRQGRDVV